MIFITTKQEYTVMRQYLRYLTHVNGIKNSEHFKQVKKAIRKYEHQPISEKRVFNADYDGMTLVYPLPEWLESVNEANEYFRTDEFIEAPSCAWDCTGARFTSWYKIFERAGRFWCYHRICRDV